jgi:hypothetical protein
MGFASFLLLQVVLLALVFAMGFVIGRGDDAGEPARAATRRAGGEVLLDDPDGGRLEGGGDPVRTAPGGSSVATPAAGRRPADIAIESAENRVTVMVSQYNDTGYGRDRARDAFAYLASKGYPVVTPRKRNGLIMLFVGAAPSVAELKPLQGELESLRGPQDQPNYFRSPFIVNIDDYL